MYCCQYSRPVTVYTCDMLLSAGLSVWTFSDLTHLAPTLYSKRLINLELSWSICLLHLVHSHSVTLAKRGKSTCGATGVELKSKPQTTTQIAFCQRTCQAENEVVTH